jgi:hypothetical protein
LKALRGVTDISNLDGPMIRFKHNRAHVQIIEVRRRIMSEQELKETLAKKVAAKPKWGITQKGLSCKICIEEQRFVAFIIIKKSRELLV